MKFNTIHELGLYLAEHNLVLSEVDIPLDVPASVVVTECDVGISTLSDAPMIKAKISENSENILFVENYESIPLSCGTGKVTFMGRTIYAGICESEENSPEIHLNIKIDNRQYNSVPFRLKKSNDSETPYIMVLNLNSITHD